MAVPQDEHERTLAFAEIAFAQIKALHQPASPRNYEIWYHYATGYKPGLNQAINETLATKHEIGDADLERLYSTYVGSTGAGVRIETVGSKMLAELEQVLDVIDAAAGSATSYSASLADASAELAGARDGAALRAVVERLLHGAKDMEATNKKLEAGLNASKQEIAQLQQNLEAVRAESFIDPLTTLSNRKFFDIALAKAMAEARDGVQTLSLLMLDIDHFKSFNDKYGHLTGDQVLRLVALAVKQNVKGQDIAARYGGEEFIVALPNTALRAATTVAEQIRRGVMSKELMKRSSGERLGRLTLSIGVAALRAGDTAQSCIARADHCLYAAKRAGRNRVICETDPEAAMPAESAPAAARVA